MKQSPRQYRRRFTDAEKASHITRWLHGTLTRKEYCAAHDLSYWTFLEWLKKWRKEHDTRPPFKRIRFCKVPAGSIPASLTDLPPAPCPSGSGIDLHVHDKYRLHLEEGFSATVLQQILRTLDELSC